MHKYSKVRVGIAGVTGYAGLELLRRLARHPYADVRHAMASSASESKRLPGLARIWDAPVEPLDAARLASETDAVFLALPDTIAAELAEVAPEADILEFDDGIVAYSLSRSTISGMTSASLARTR